MRRFILMLIGVTLIGVFSVAQTPSLITGHMEGIDSAACVTRVCSLHIELRNFSGFVPRSCQGCTPPGIVLSTLDVPVDSLGAFSTNLWSNLNIIPANTFYTISFIYKGKTIFAGNWTILADTNLDEIAAQHLPPTPTPPFLPVLLNPTGNQVITGGFSLTDSGGFIGPLTGNVTGNASTATALATTPTLCTTGQAPTGVDVNGNAVACAVATLGVFNNNSPLQWKNSGGTTKDVLVMDASNNVILKGETTAKLITMQANPGTAGASLDGTAKTLTLGTDYTLVLTGADKRYAVPPGSDCTAVASNSGICASLDGDYWTWNTGASPQRLTHSPCVNRQSGATYTFVASDRGCLVLSTNSSSPTYTLPQANSGTTVNKFDGFWDTYIWNNGTTSLTVNPTTSNINGAASLVLPAGAWAHIFSDNTDYWAYASLSTVTSTGFLPFPLVVAHNQNLSRTTNVPTVTLIASTASAANYRFAATINCTLAAAGTVGLTVAWTDTSGTAQTITTGNINCAVLGASSRQQIFSNFRAGSATAITYSTTITANSPTWDETVILEQLTTQ